MSIPMSSSKAKYDEVREKLTYTEDVPLDRSDNPQTETQEASDLDTICRAMNGVEGWRVSCKWATQGNLKIWKFRVPMGLAFSVETALRLCHYELTFVTTTENGAVFAGCWDEKPVVIVLVAEPESEEEPDPYYRVGGLDAEGNLD